MKTLVIILFFISLTVTAIFFKGIALGQEINVSYLIISVICTSAFAIWLAFIKKVNKDRQD